jgi:hypothetical protein
MTPAKDILGQHALELIASLQKERDIARDIAKRLVANIGERGTCKGCLRDIVWITHKNGVSAPYDLDGVNHFATCPKSNQFKKEPKTK